jgi:iron(III) transport system permease protein
VLGVTSGLAAGIICFFVAHILVRTNFRARKVLEFVSWLPWAIPGVLLSMGLVTVVLEIPPLRFMYGSMFILVVAMVLFRFPLGVQLLQSGLMQVNKELEEASTICGGSHMITQRRINIPILMPMLTAVGLMTFVTAINEVSGVVLLASTDLRTLSLLSLDYLIGTQTEPESAAVITTVMILICVGVALIARMFGISLGGTLAPTGESK